MERRLQRVMPSSWLIALTVITMTTCTVPATGLLSTGEARFVFSSGGHSDFPLLSRHDMTSVSVTSNLLHPTEVMDALWTNSHPTPTLTTKLTSVMARLQKFNALQSNTSSTTTTTTS